jgi:hypothetical protein
MTEYKAARVVYANNDGSYVPATGSLVDAINAAEPELTAVASDPTNGAISVSATGNVVTLADEAGDTLVSTNGVVEYTAAG